MRLLADENVPKELIESLRRDGHEVVWIREIAPGLSDSRILVMAQSNARVILTFDKDFGELAFQHGLPATSGIILLRMSKSSVAEIINIVGTALRQRTGWEHHFSVIEDQRIRMTPLRPRRSK